MFILLFFFTQLIKDAQLPERDVDNRLSAKSYLIQLSFLSCPFWALNETHKELDDDDGAGILDHRKGNAEIRQKWNYVLNQNVQ